MKAGPGTFEWPLELLRGGAALMVMLAHYQGIAGVHIDILGFGRTGVDLFFVLSGYVFARYLHGDRIEIGPFFVRRLFRIYPLYLTALVAYLMVRWYGGHEIDYVWRHLLFLHTWESVEIAHYYNPAFWSLPPEVEFYLALPLLAILASRKGGLPKICAVALVLHLTLAYLSPTTPHTLTWASLLTFHLPGLMAEFALGAVAYHIARQGLGIPMRLMAAILGVSAWVALAMIESLLKEADGRHALLLNDLTRGNMGLYAAVCFSLIIVACVRWRGPTPGWLVTWALFMGNISYGVYLFHSLLPRIGRLIDPDWTGPVFALTCVVTTIVLAWIAHMTIEAPLRSVGRNIARRLAVQRL